jgi:Nucleotidyl transferase AbiEii toxin, Type IV TA system
MSFDQFLAVIRAFEREGVEYVLVGGVAVNIHGIVRTTEDIDFFVRPTDANIERVRAALRSLWADPHIDEITAADLSGGYSTIRYGPPTGDIVIDLLGGLGTAWRFDDLASERHAFGGVSVRVATPATLFKMKRGTVRARDHADAVLLRERFGLREEEEV